MNSPKAKPRTALGSALHVHGEAVDHVESLYLQAAGEITDEVEEAEAARDVTGREAAEHLARYLLWVEDQEAAVEREKLRLSIRATDYASRKAWAEARLAELVPALTDGGKRLHVGTYKIALRPSTAVEVDEGVEASLPDAWSRLTKPKLAQVEPDKKAIKAAMLPWHEGEPPGPGWLELDHADHPGLCHASPGPDGQAGPDGWVLARLADGAVLRMQEAGLTFVDEPGLETVRWRHGHPGVRLVTRQHVGVK